MPAIGYNATDNLSKPAPRPAPKAAPPSTFQRLASAIAQVPAAAGRAVHTVASQPAPVQHALASQVARSSKFAPSSSSRAQPSGRPAQSSVFNQPSAALQALGHALLHQYSGADRAFLLPTDTVGSPASNVRYGNVIRQLETKGAFNQSFEALKQAGLIPGGTKEPAVNFPARGLGKQGDLSYQTGGQVYISPATTYAATDPQSPAHSWGLEALVHELAHSMQSPQTLQSVPAREGGAQAFADAAAPVAIGPIATHDTNYSGYVRSARQRGPSWYMRGQFQGPKYASGQFQAGAH